MFLFEDLRLCVVGHNLSYGSLFLGVLIEEAY